MYPKIDPPNPLFMRILFSDLNKLRNNWSLKCCYGIIFIIIKNILMLKYLVMILLFYETFIFIFKQIQE